MHQKDQERRIASSRLLRTCLTFTKSVVVSVNVSKIGTLLQWRKSGWNFGGRRGRSRRLGWGSKVKCEMGTPPHRKKGSEEGAGQKKNEFST